MASDWQSVSNELSTILCIFCQTVRTPIIINGFRNRKKSNERIIISTRTLLIFAFQQFCGGGKHSVAPSPKTDPIPSIRLFAFREITQILERVQLLNNAWPPINHNAFSNPVQFLFVFFVGWGFWVPCVDVNVPFFFCEVVPLFWNSREI